MKRCALEEIEMVSLNHWAKTVNCAETDYYFCFSEQRVALFKKKKKNEEETWCYACAVQGTEHESYFGHTIRNCSKPKNMSV